MHSIVSAIEVFFGGIPLQFLEIWGRVGYLLGFVLMLFAFGGFTFRQGARWGIGRERQSWDAKAWISVAATFVLILASGYIGSFIVLVPGAQTFESLKDLSVFLCILLFGYPALIVVPIAYGLSDLIEGVPPGFLQDWIFGYFINAACFWMAYAFIGKDPDFRKASTWGSYLLFVAIFMNMEPELWGYICSDKFTAAISYRSITPALFFTTLITWIIAPVAMLGALPLARRYGLFWAEIPGHVKERPLGRRDWIWVSGKDQPPTDRTAMATTATTAITGRGLPIQMAIVTSFVILVLLMVGATAYFALRSAEDDANKLAARLHQEISENINLQLDDNLEKSRITDAAQLRAAISTLLEQQPIAKDGRAFIIDDLGRQIAASVSRGEEDLVIQEAILKIRLAQENLDNQSGSFSFRFDVVTARPLSRETWLAQATHYEDRSGNHSNWILVTVMPESYYLGGVHAGNSQSAMVSAVALILALLVASVLAAKVTTPIRRLAQATQALARGELSARVPGSPMEELDVLSQSFNHMAEQLNESTARLQLATSAANLGLWDLNLVTGVATRTLEYDRIFGYPSLLPEWTFDMFLEHVLPEDTHKVTGLFGKAIEEQGNWSFECRIRRVDGEVRWISAIGGPRRTSEGKAWHMAGLVQDITERKRVEEVRAQLEAQLRESQKMEALGTLAGGVAHDFNNALAAILGNVELARQDVGTGHPALQSLEEIGKASRRAKNLVQQILAFSRRQTTERKVISLAPVVQEAAKFLRSTIPAGVSLDIACAPQAPQVLADAIQIEQVLINLGGNAWYAIEGQERAGMIEIRLEEEVRGDLRFAVLTVRDNGRGMDEATKARIFEPFFTTKPVDKGTGLGLSVVYGIVHAHEADIEVHSTPGEGTVFLLRFSAAQPPAVAATKSDRRAGGADAGKPRALLSGGQRILYVDDEEAVVSLITRLLARQGYRVSGHTDPHQALAMVRADPGQFDLVVTDYNMPGMSGLEVARTLHEIRADLPVILMSGHITEELQREAPAAGVRELIFKVDAVEDVCAAVARAIES